MAVGARRFADDEIVVEVAADDPPILRTRPRRVQDGHRVAVVVHGLCESRLRFLELARFLNRRGWTVLLPDLPGHRAASEVPELEQRTIEDVLTAASSADLRSRFAAWTARDRETLRAARRRQSKVQRRVVLDREADRLAEALAPLTSGVDQVAVIGHSLGGLFALLLSDRLGARVAGVALLSPALGPVAPPGSFAATRRYLARTWDEARRGRIGWATRLGSVVGAFGVAADVEWVTPWVTDLEDERALQASDPWIQRSVPLSFLQAIQLRMGLLHREPGVLPARGLLIAAREDAVVATPDAESWVREHRPGWTIAIEESVPSHDLLRSSRGDATRLAMIEMLDSAG